MVRQSAIIIQPRQVRTAHIADLQFLVTRGAGGVGEGFELALALLLGGQSGAHFEELVRGEVDGAEGSGEFDFGEAEGDCF
jgi:hypothetical protein